MWVVDTGAGRAITPDTSWFSGNLQPGNTHCFTYGNGTVSNSSLKGSIKTSVLNPRGTMSSWSLSDISCDRQCDSNRLSAYYLARQGYRKLQSKSGEFIFFFGKDSKLLFAAVTIGGVYYLPSKKPRKTKVFSARTTTYSSILKEWHLRLGHLGKER
jgi:hypothetical protein